MESSVSLAFEWMAAHPQEVEKHAKKWIVVTPEGIIESADSIRQLKKKDLATRAMAIVFQVPDPLAVYLL